MGAADKSALPAPDASVEEYDEYWMRRALDAAAMAQKAGEVPIGAVLLDSRGGTCLAEGMNQPISTHDPTAHAEIIALREGAKRAGNYRLPGAILYVTLEPCLMCFGALVQARVAEIIYATGDTRIGVISGPGGDFTALPRRQSSPTDTRWRTGRSVG